MSKNTNTTELGTLGIALQAALLKAGRDPITGAPVANTVVETETEERERLVAKVKELKLPGYGTCTRWKIETLRSKVADAPSTTTTNPVEDTNVTDTASTPETTEVVAAPVNDVVAAVAEVVETAEVIAVASPETSEDASSDDESGDDINEVDGIVVGQIVPASVDKKLAFGVKVKLGENGPTALCHTKELRGGSHHNRKERHNNLKDGDELAVEVVRIRAPKEGESHHRITVSEKVIQDRDVLEGIVCGTISEAGTLVTGTVKDVRSDYLLVNITEGPAAGFIGLLHATKVSGESREERDAKIASYSVGQEVTAEAIEVSPRKKGDLQISLSLAANDQREKVQGILALAASDDQPGETVTAVVKSRKDYGFFVEIKDGPAAGRHALVHVSQAPGRNRDERDAYVASVEIGAEVEAEVIKAERGKEGQINIGLSMTSGVRRERSEAFSALAADTTSAYMATVVKSFGDGLLVEFSTPFGTFKGKLPASEAPGSLNRDDHVRVKVTSVDGNRVTLNRRGL